jgi:hypothetical protein
MAIFCIDQHSPFKFILFAFFAATLLACHKGTKAQRLYGYIIFLLPCRQANKGANSNLLFLSDFVS